MQRLQLPSTVQGDPTAQAAVDAVNQAIDTIQSEAKQIEADGAALVAEALGCDPADAPKLAKRVEALRVRRLANIMRELRIPALKEAAQIAIRAAAVAAIEVQQVELDKREAVINKAADDLGLPDGAQRLSMIRTDKERNLTVSKLSDARHLANNFFSMTDGDRAAVEELKRSITQALSV